MNVSLVTEQGVEVICFLLRTNHNRVWSDRFTSMFCFYLLLDMKWLIKIQFSCFQPISLKVSQAEVDPLVNRSICTTDDVHPQFSQFPCAPRTIFPDNMIPVSRACTYQTHPWSSTLTRQIWCFLSCSVGLSLYVWRSWNDREMENSKGGASKVCVIKNLLFGFAG